MDPQDPPPPESAPGYFGIVSDRSETVGTFELRKYNRNTYNFSVHVHARASRAISARSRAAAFEWQISSIAKEFCLFLAICVGIRTLEVSQEFGTPMQFFLGKLAPLQKNWNPHP